MATAKAPRRLITQQAAAEQLSVSVKSIRRWISEGRLTGYRVGGRVLRIDADELAAFARPIPAGSTRQSE